MRPPQIPVQILAYNVNTDAYWLRIPCFHFADSWESLACVALLDCGTANPRIDEPTMTLLATQMESVPELYLTIVAEERIELAGPQMPAGFAEIPLEAFSLFSDALNAIDRRAKIHRGQQLAEHPLLNLALNGQGWMQVQLRLGPHELRETISYLSQPLEQLLLLALCLEHGVHQYHWSWDLEGTYLHASVNSGDFSLIEIAVSKSYEAQPDITDQQLFQVMVDPKELSCQILAAGADLLRKHGLDGYRCDWGHAFPQDLFAALSRKLQR